MAASPRHAARALPALLGFGAVTALSVLAAVEIADTGQPSVPQRITATPSRLAPGYSGMSDYPLAQVDSVGPKDDRFIALMTGMADRQHFPRGHRDAMITAAHQVCAMVSAGSSVSQASSRLVVGYRFTDAQAQALGAMAVQVYCPENRP